MIHQVALFVMLAAASLGLAQQTIRFGGESTRIRNLDQFLEQLARSRSGMLVVLDEAGLEAAMQARLREDALVELAVPLQGFKTRDALGKAFIEKYGWSEEARWAFLDPTGAVRLDGKSLPTATVLAEQLANAGYVDRGQELERFLSQHKDHLEAMEHLLVHRFTVARARMVAQLPSLVPPAMDESAPPPPVKLLSEGEDARIWGAAADLLDRFLRQDGWMLGSFGLRGGAPWIRQIPEAAKHSPRMMDVGKRHLRTVAEAVLQNPSQEGLWHLYVALSGEAPDLRKLVAAAERSPSDMRLGQTLPPAPVMMLFIESCRRARDWAVLRDVCDLRMAKVRELQERMQVLAEGNSGIRYSGGAAGEWPTTLAPLLEAYLQLGDVTKAEHLLKDIAGWGGIKDVYARAAVVARRCKQDGIAQRWEGLGPAKEVSR